MSNNSIASSRVTWVDVSKGIGIIFVILGHLSVPYLTAWIYTFHMPLFFFLSGVVFSGTKYDTLTFIKKRIKGLLIPYFVLGLGIFIFFTVVHYLDSTPLDMISDASKSPLELFKLFLTQKHFWTVWYLACLFIAEIVFYFIVKIAKNKLVIVATVSTVLCALVMIYYRLGGDTLPWNIDTAFVAQFFICLGYLFSKSKKLRKIKELVTNSKLNIKKILVVFILFGINFVFAALSIKLGGGSLDMSMHLYGNEIFTIISAVAGTLLVISVASVIKSGFLEYLGRNTMLIFAWHSRIMIPLINYIYLWIGVFQNNSLVMQFVYAFVTTVLILSILLPLDYLIQKSPLKFMLGR